MALSLARVCTSKGQPIVMRERSGGLEAGVLHGNAVLQMRYQCEACHDWNEVNTPGYYCKPNQHTSLWVHFCNRSCYDTWSQRKVGEAMSQTQAVGPGPSFLSGISTMASAAASFMRPSKRRRRQVDQVHRRRRAERISFLASGCHRRSRGG